MREVIAKVLPLLQGQLRTTGVSVVREQPDFQPFVYGDRVQLQQVVLNLMMNAIHAMRSVSDRARVLKIGIARHGAGMLCISVSDSGIGLHPAQRERIFEAFYTSKPDGMGMGLTISRSIVESHGGRLWATPNAGPGVTFQFLLPLLPAAAL